MPLFWHKRRLKRLKERGVDELVRLLATGSMKERTEMANALWGLSHELSPEEIERVISALDAAANDVEPTVRGHAIVALVSMSAPGAIDRAVAVLGDSDWFVRTLVAAELGHQDPDPEIVAALIPLLSDPDGFVRQQAAAALGSQQDERAIPALEAMLERENKDAEAKDAAKEALLRLRALSAES